MATEKMKGKLRRINKAINIANVAVSCLTISNDLHVLFESIEKTRNMASTPAWVWRHDKPAIDKRRFRRYQRGGHDLP